MTGVGVLLGTAAYMSPEQIRGKAVDKRADVWAFGCVLFEMLGGRRAFDGESVADVLGAITRIDPEWSALPLGLPLSIRWLLEGCLQKDPSRRIASLSVARFAIDRSDSAQAVAVASAPRRSGGISSRVALPGIAAIALAAVAALALVLARPSPASLPQNRVTFEVLPPPGVSLSPSEIASTAQLAISPDGRRLAFVAAARHSPRQIWVRALDSLETKALVGTEGGAFPFWSPDSRSLGFFAGGKLKRIDLAGGAAVTLADSLARGGSWNAQDRIVFCPQPNGIAMSIPASGGVATPVSRFGADDVVGQNWPQLLPDGQHVLFYQRSRNAAHQGIAVSDLQGNPPTLLTQAQGMPVYGSGYLGNVRDGTLFVQPFDPSTLTLSGNPIRVVDNVGYFAGSFGFAAVSMSPAGVLAYGPGVRVTTSLHWRDRAGALTQTIGQPDVYTAPRLSADQRTIVVAVASANMAQRDLWFADAAQGTLSARETFDPAADWFPVWSADGRRVYFGTTREGVTNVYEKAGAEPEKRALAQTPSIARYPYDASVDGRYLAIVQSMPTGYDVGVVDLSAGGDVQPVLTSPPNEVQPRFSPNSRWLAYASDESGQFEIYVRAFPAGDNVRRISTGGGMQPEWRRDGKELFFVSSDGRMMAVTVSSDAPSFDAGTPTALFDVEMPSPNAPYPNEYAVTADGKRFLVNSVVEQPVRQALTVMLNWTEGLERK